MTKRLNSRSKGNAYEIRIASEMRTLGFDNCITSRAESKSMDDKGVDLMYTGPFYFQLKCTEKYPNFHDLLFNKMPSVFHIPVVMNKKNRKGEIVCMKKEDFYVLINMLLDANLISKDKNLADLAE